jgi:alkylated DNA repair dioxygenase AlkB
MTSTKLGDSELLYAESWLPNADGWFDRLRNDVPWSAERVMMYGKDLVLRREICNYGADYDYNPKAKPAVEWGGPVAELKTMLETFTGRVFTQCACNLYPDGETGIGLHHDKRHPLLVASISFGAVRAMGMTSSSWQICSSVWWIISRCWFR